MHRERREFALTSLAHPDLRLDDVDEAGAVALLLRRYLSAFGPASIVDFRWWSGLTHRRAAAGRPRCPAGLRRPGSEGLLRHPQPLRRRPIPHRLVQHHRRSQSEDHRRRPMRRSLAIRSPLAPTFVDTFAPLPPAQQRALVEQADRMTEFLRSEPS
ncbi:DNA glycosylase AlkZ-like family protein [Cryptosporangium phraense]|uniref:DNA glycosylase AlkZ-like family protein n=1 Tax=Cryptosporangium phraense TaxID=2593070 RepID=UPI003B847F6D